MPEACLQYPESLILIRTLRGLYFCEGSALGPSNERDQKLVEGINVLIHGYNEGSTSRTTKVY